MSISAAATAPKTIASFDVGIKNMAYCVIETHDDNLQKILAWGIINMVEPPPPPPMCGFAACCKAAAYSHDGVVYCKKHTDKTKIVSVKDFTTLKNKTLEKIREFATDKKLTITGDKKAAIVENLTAEIRQKLYIPLSAAPTAENATKMDLITIGRIMTTKLNEIFAPPTPDTHAPHALLYPLTDVYIENQMSTIAIRMKTIQGMLTQYFIGGINGCLTPPVNISYISASNKLKGRVDTKTTYGERKKLSIEFCRKILEESDKDEVKKWAPFFHSFGAKRDDLADAFLQGISTMR
jgi:hypothetical protein